MSKTGQLLQALRAGPANAARLSTLTGIPTRRVTALLRHHIEKGRVAVGTKPCRGLHGWVNVYHLVDQQQLAIEKARALLEGQGYTVIAPEGVAP